MSLSIEQLTRHPQLGVTYLAGRSGGSRPCCGPTRAAARAVAVARHGGPAAHRRLQLSRRWHRAGCVHPAASLLRAVRTDARRGAGAAPLTMEAAAAADALDFPVLQAAYEIPFVSVARAVAESNSHDISRRLHTLLRIYDMVRRSSAEESPGDGLIAQMADEIECYFSVLDLVSGLDPPASPAHGPRARASPGWSTACRASWALAGLQSHHGGRGRPPLFSRFVRAPTWPWSWLLDTTSSKPTWRCCNTWPRSPRSRWTEVWAAQ